MAPHPAASIGRPPFTNEQLALLRQQGDPVADALVSSLFAAGDRKVFGKILKDITRNDQLSYEGLIGQGFSEEIATYFSRHAALPSWANPAQLAVGSAFFDTYAADILYLLGVQSLPYCYAAADGAQVLYLSRRIADDTQKRLAETAYFVLEATASDAFEPTGTAIASALKVRLTHAAVRFHLLRGNAWDTAWGLPVNQEDMAGTNLAFSYIPITGMKRMGIRVEERTANAYLHRWRLIGHFMGVDASLSMDTWHDAAALDKAIAARQFRPSEAGKALTAMLLQHLNWRFSENFQGRVPKGLVESLMRRLLGNEVSDIIGVPPANAASALLPLIVGLNIFQQFMPLPMRARQNSEAIARVKEEMAKHNGGYEIPSKV